MRKALSVICLMVMLPLATATSADSSLLGVDGSLSVAEGSLSGADGSLSGADGSLSVAEGSLSGAEGSLSGAEGSSPGAEGSFPREDSAASKRFSDALLAINTMAGKFEQRIFDKEGEELQLTSGEFQIKRPGHFLWKIAPPYEQIVIGTPESLKVYDPDLEQLSVHQQNSLAGTPASLISGDLDSISKDYDVEYSVDEGSEVFQLRQKDSELSAFASLSFSFSKKGGKLVLNRMLFVDKLGQRTEVSMSKVKINKHIDDNAFQFLAPEGTDIIVDG